MNPCIIELFSDRNATTKFTLGLPQAFERASLELPGGNPAVGFLREHAITGFFKGYFGDRAKIPAEGNKREFDVDICGHQLSIKTVTGRGRVKVLWTADTYSVNAEIDGGYSPSCDMFLTRIFWEQKKESVFYIPKEVQIEVFESDGADNYLSSATMTNNRGIEISTLSMNTLQAHADTRKLSVNWEKLGIEYTPYDRWEDFWKKVQI